MSCRRIQHLLRSCRSATMVADLQDDHFCDVDSAAAFNTRSAAREHFRPRMTFEHSNGFGTDLSRRATFFQRDLADEVFDQKRDIVRADSQWRRLQSDSAEVLQQVITEPAFHGQSIQVAVRCRNEPNIGSIHRSVKYCGCSLFQQLSQSFLEWQGNVSTLSSRIEPPSPIQIAGEAIRSRITKELMFQRFYRLQAAVDSQERLASSAAAQRCRPSAIRVVPLPGSPRTRTVRSSSAAMRM